MKYAAKVTGGSGPHLLFRIFLVWATVGLLITGFNITVLTVEQWNVPPVIRDFFQNCLLWGDFIFLALSFAVILQLYASWLGWVRAVGGAVLVGALGGVAEWVGTRTGLPFGSYHYTENMGPMIGGQLPWAIPLAWWTVIGSFHLLLRAWWPSLGSWSTAVMVGILATGFDYIMEPYAWQIKTYWIWHQGSVPWLNYASWFVLSLTFSIMLAALGAWGSPGKSVAVPRALWVMVLICSLFLLGRAVHSGWF
ncbi:MAG: carotenoid biosynthesis protein [Candidatus Methylacidiphilales bacterium]